MAQAQSLETEREAGHQWLMPVIPATAQNTKQEDSSPGFPGKEQNPISKITRAKKGWRCGSNGRAPAWQVQGPELTPLPQEKKREI
jgi:hypothetical protein